jgi:hypothetical protein
VQHWRRRRTHYIHCRNPSLGLMSKPRAYKGAGQEWSLKVTFHALKSVRDCEGMNPHTPKCAPTFGVEVPMDSPIFIRKLKGSKLILLRSSLYHWKALGMYISKMGSYDLFGYLNHKLWPKERLGVKVPVWLLTTKSQESPLFTYV